MKKTTFIVAYLLVALLACRKSDTPSPADTDLKQISTITQQMPDNDALSRKILASLGDNAKEQFGSSDILISKLEQKQGTDNIRLYEVEYSVASGQIGTALVVVEE